MEATATGPRPKLSNAAARRLFLSRHGLCEAGGGSDLDGLLALIRQLGFVQIDSINTVERAHHMILGARRRRYRPRQMATLLERRRVLFEHWTHDAAAIPTEYFPYWRLRFARNAARLRERWRRWKGAGFDASVDDVLTHIRKHGPVLARDMADRVDNGEKRGGAGWWDWHPSKTALEYLWHTGALAVRRRDGFQKVFDLTERVIPEAHLAPSPAEAEVVDWACTGALERLGFATSGEIAAFWDLITPQEAKDWCAARLGDDLIEVDIAGADDGTVRRAFARPDVLAQAESAPPPPGGIRVLSPFDPALRDRNRTERLFGFHYRIEVFTPAAKRRYGYYVFPLLEGDRLVGRIDMKRRAETGTLAVRALWPERGIRFGKGRLARLDSELARMARFAGCDTVTFEDGWLREASGPQVP